MTSKLSHNKLGMTQIFILSIFLSFFAKLYQSARTHKFFQRKMHRNYDENKMCPEIWRHPVQLPMAGRVLLIFSKQSKCLITLAEGRIRGGGNKYTGCIIQLLYSEVCQPCWQKIKSRLRHDLFPEVH